MRVCVDVVVTRACAQGCANLKVSATQRLALTECSRGKFFLEDDTVTSFVVPYWMVRCVMYCTAPIFCFFFYYYYFLLIVLKICRAASR